MFILVLMSSRCSSDVATNSDPFHKNDLYEINETLREFKIFMKNKRLASTEL